MNYYSRRHQDGKRPHKWLLALSIVLLLILLGAGGGLLGYKRMYQANLRAVNSSKQEDVVVTIPSGSSPKNISKILKASNLVRETWAVERYIQSKELSDQLQAGTYKFRQSQDVPTMVDAMVNGRVAVDLFTILPTQRIDQIRAAFLAAKFDAAAVDKALNPANYAGNPALVDKPATANLEGYLYPDSFQRIAETTPEIIVLSSLAEMSEHLTPELRAAFASEKLSVYQAVTLASIVEREANTQEDRDKVAQVFLKRLSINMPLGSDVTVLYGSQIAGQGDNLQFDSAYNTFKHPGLPVGPISNVSRSSLQAVAHPANSDYLYFVAGDDGETHFSKTQAEHEAAAKQYCKKLCGQQ